MVNHWRFWSTPLLLVWLVILLSSCVIRGRDFEEERYQEEITKRFPLAEPAELRVSNQDGAILVGVGEPGGVTLKAVKRAGGPSEREAKQAAARVEVETRAEGNRVVVAVRQPRQPLGIGFSTSWAVVDLELTVPKRTTVDLSSVDGDIELTGIEGEADLRTTDGDIQVSGVKGTLSAVTVDGNMRLRKVAGRVESESTDGEIEVQGRLSLLRARAVDGDIVVEVEPGSTLTGDWALRTVDGEVELRAPEDLSAEIEAETRDGSIYSDFPTEGKRDREEEEYQWARVRLKEGGHRIFLRTSDGDILILKGRPEKKETE